MYSFSFVPFQFYLLGDGLHFFLRFSHLPSALDSLLPGPRMSVLADKHVQALPLDFFYFHIMRFSRQQVTVYLSV